MKKLIIAGLVLFPLVGCAPPPKLVVTIPPPPKLGKLDLVGIKKVQELRSEIVKTKHFSEDDRALAIPLAMSHNPKESAPAIDLLITASRSKMYPKADVVTILEDQITNDAGPACNSYFQDYEKLIGVGLDCDSDLQKTVNAWEWHPNWPNVIYSKEKTFIAKLLKDKRSGNRLLAAELLCSKIGLSRDDKAWSLAIVTSQSKAKDFRERELWSFAGRVIAAKS